MIDQNWYLDPSVQTSRVIILWFTAYTCKKMFEITCHKKWSIMLSINNLIVQGSLPVIRRWCVHKFWCTQSHKRLVTFSGTRCAPAAFPSVIVALVICFLKITLLHNCFPKHPAGTSVISSYISNFCSNFSMGVYENFFWYGKIYFEA